MRFTTRFREYDDQSKIDFTYKDRIMKRKLFFASWVACALFAAIAAPSCITRTETPLRLLQYNIADGMWYDQFDGYDRVVAWMQQQDCDIAALCETATHWDREQHKLLRDDPARYLPDSLPQLAARWGHEYVAVGAFQDNYPVAVSSRYPFELVRPLGGEELSHGALHVKIRGVNYVVLHLWPQPYSLQDKDKTRSDGLGDSTRRVEIRTILERTLRNPEFRNERYWVMLGDFNTVSPVDSAYYASPRNYEIHTIVREAYPCDVIERFHPGTFIPSINRNDRRIDFTYCSEAMGERLLGAETLDDDFTRVASDHKPTMVVFRDIR